MGDSIVDGIIGVLGIAFGREWFAPLVLLPAMFAWAVRIGVLAWNRTAPYRRAVDARNGLLRRTLGQGRSPQEEHAAFAAAWAEIDAAMDEPGSARDPHVEALRRAWHEFKETVVFVDGGAPANTARPTAFFLRAQPRQQTLVLWSNLFVGIGLVLTFIGIVVALHTAAGSLTASAREAQTAMGLLLTQAAAKFFASIGGLGASLSLRGVEHHLTKVTGRETEALCALLERGLLYLPPQRLAAQQLTALEAQGAALRNLGETLADDVGERMAEAMAPVAAALAALNTVTAESSERLGTRLDGALTVLTGGVVGMGREVRTALGEGAAEAINSAASGQLKALGDTLEQLRAELSGMSHTVDASARSAATVLQGAAEGIRDAGAKASVTMQASLSEALAKAVDSSGETFRRAVEQTGSGFQLAGLSLTAAVKAAAERSAEAGRAFEAAGVAAGRAGEVLGGAVAPAEAVGQVLARAAADSAQVVGPLGEAARALATAADSFAETDRAERDAAVLALGQVTELAGSVRKAQASAKRAWDEHRKRFERADKSLEEASATLAATLAEHAAQLRAVGAGSNGAGRPGDGAPA